MLQAWQVPQLAVAQHTPSTQELPVRQSPSPAQGWPRRFLSPHAFVVRSQMLGVAQSVSETQVVLQAVPLHEKGAHDWVLAGLQAPAPSQVRPSVCVAAFAGHEGGAQDVPGGNSSQAPLPSQKPVVSQLAAPAFVHAPVGSAPPLATGAHVPPVAASAHDRHVPVQAVRQQTPCAQNPVAHSAPAAQAAPGDLSPHDPSVQTAGAAQSASAAHVALHAETPQRKGKQEVAGGVTQAPAPSHVARGVDVVPEAGQLGSPQEIPSVYF
jgi:hypothetical protein